MAEKMILNATAELAKEKGFKSEYSDTIFIVRQSELHSWLMDRSITVIPKPKWSEVYGEIEGYWIRIYTKEEVYHSDELIKEYNDCVEQGLVMGLGYL